MCACNSQGILCDPAFFWQQKCDVPIHLTLLIFRVNLIVRFNLYKIPFIILRNFDIIICTFFYFALNVFGEIKYMHYLCNEYNGMQKYCSFFDLHCVPTVRRWLSSVACRVLVGNLHFVHTFFLWSWAWT